MNHEEELEICYQCGRSVAMGHGLFVHRIGSGDSIPAKREMGCHSHKAAGCVESVTRKSLAKLVFSFGLL